MGMETHRVRIIRALRPRNTDLVTAFEPCTNTGNLGSAAELVSCSMCHVHAGISMRAKQNIMVSSQITQAMRQHLEPRLDASPVIPMYWSTETAEAPEDQARQFRRVVYG